MITCPECQTEYEKEAKYCFKCRIAFTDDIPESIAKYLRHRNSAGGYTSYTKSNTTSFQSSTGFGQDKPPLQRNISVPTMKSGSMGPNHNLNSNNIHITSSPPTTSFTPNNTNNNTNNTNAQRPRIHSTPAPPSHPLPPTPTRMSVPISSTPPPHPPKSNTPPPPATSTSPPIRHTPPITSAVATPPTVGSNNSTPGGTNKNPHTMRTISPVNTPPQSTDSGNGSPHMSYDNNNNEQQQQPQPVRRPLSRRIPPPPPNKKLVRAVWDCIPEQEGDLEFYKDEIISVITQDHETGWWMGSVTRNGQTTMGLFPGNYTEPCQ